jgi:peptidoglycan hydrolase-like protein with peptidoglycan-binding domain
MVYNVDPYLAIDGIDGPATTHDVEVFQWLHGLTIDGIVGPATGNWVYYYDVYDGGVTWCFNYVRTSD